MPKKPASKSVESSSTPRARARAGGVDGADWAPAYLAALVENLGQKTKAATAAGIKFVTVSARRCRDPKFRADEAVIMAAVADAIESEIYRRAMDGVRREKTNAKGEIIATETEYSDALLLAAAKRIDPTWREKHQVEVTNKGFATRAEALAALEAARAEIAANGRS